MLRVRDLKVGYDLFELRANFSIQTGSLVAILGPSGSGKTTLINTIAGFIQSRTGIIEWNQLALAPFSPGERPINILFQDHNLFPHLDVEKNVAIKGDILSKPIFTLSDTSKAKLTLDNQTNSRAIINADGNKNKINFALL